MHSDGIAVLKAEIEYLTERIDGLEELRDQVDALADRMLAELDGPKQHDAPTAPTVWTDLDVDQARGTLYQLWEWMGEVLVHHPHVMEVIRPCWYRHPASVQVLLDVRAAWVLAYRSQASVHRALEWSQVHLPHLERVLMRDLGQCTSVRHDPRMIPLPALEDNDMHSYLQWWAQRNDPATGPHTR